MQNESNSSNFAPPPPPPPPAAASGVSATPQRTHPPSTPLGAGNRPQSSFLVHPSPSQGGGAPPNSNSFSAARGSGGGSTTMTYQQHLAMRGRLPSDLSAVTNNNGIAVGGRSYHSALGVASTTNTPFRDQQSPFQGRQEQPPNGNVGGGTNALSLFSQQQQQQQQQQQPLASSSGISMPPAPLPPPKSGIPVDLPGLGSGWTAASGLVLKRPKIEVVENAPRAKEGVAIGARSVGFESEKEIKEHLVSLLARKGYLSVEAVICCKPTTSNPLPPATMTGGAKRGRDSFTVSQQGDNSDFPQQPSATAALVTQQALFASGGAGSAPAAIAVAGTTPDVLAALPQKMGHPSKLAEDIDLPITDARRLVRLCSQYLLVSSSSSSTTSAATGESLLGGANPDPHSCSSSVEELVMKKFGCTTCGILLPTKGDGRQVLDNTGKANSAADTAPTTSSTHDSGVKFGGPAKYTLNPSSTTANSTHQQHARFAREGVEVPSLDKHLNPSSPDGGGGIPTGIVTELVGGSGSGKSRLLTELAANCAAADRRHVLWLDCDGKFSFSNLANSIRRVVVTSQRNFDNSKTTTGGGGFGDEDALVEEEEAHLHEEMELAMERVQVLKRERIETLESLFPTDTPVPGAVSASEEDDEALFDKRCRDPKKLRGEIEALLVNRKCKLLVLDSVASLVHRSYSHNEHIPRNDALLNLLSWLKHLAEAAHCAVVVTNHASSYNSSTTMRDRSTNPSTAAAFTSSSAAALAEQFQKQTAAAAYKNAQAALGNTFHHGVNLRLVIEEGKHAFLTPQIRKLYTEDMVQQYHRSSLSLAQDGALADATSWKQQLVMEDLVIPHVIHVAKAPMCGEARFLMMLNMPGGGAGLRNNTSYSEEEEDLINLSSSAAAVLGVVDSKHSIPLESIGSGADE